MLALGHERQIRAQFLAGAAMYQQLDLRARFRLMENSRKRSLDLALACEHSDPR